MAYSFGDDGGFDWGSLLNTAVQSAGQVVSAALKPTPTAPAAAVARPPTASSSSTQTYLLLAAAAALAFVLFSMRRGRR